MAREFMIIKGNSYYLVDLDANKGYLFTEFGEGIESIDARYVASLGGSVTEIDILSILSDSTKSESELYFRGERLSVKGMGSSIFLKISKSLPKVSYSPFRIVRPEASGLTQILIPLKKGECSMMWIKHLVGA